MRDRRAFLLDVALVGFVLLTRLPFVHAGYGLDPDAYRVVRSATAIANDATYEASRRPGAPVHEASTALLIPGGPAATNLGSALMCALAVVQFRALLRRWRIRDATPIALTLAFVPVVYVASATTLDYVWALALGLAGLARASGNRPLTAGLLLGLAAGCRITTGVLVLPAALLLVARSASDARLRSVLRLALATGITAAVLFAPVLVRHGPSWFGFADLSPVVPAVALARATTGVWGDLGSVVLSAMFLLALWFWPRRERSETRVEARRVSVLVIGLFVAAFLRLPHESAYLIVCVPFVLVLLGDLLPRVALRVGLVGLGLASFVAIGPDRLPAPGPVWVDHEARLRVDRIAQEAADVLRASDEPVLLVTGSYHPRMLHAFDFEVPAPHVFAYVLDSAEDLARARARGYSVHVMPGQQRLQRRLAGVDLTEHGVEPIVDDEG